MAASVSPACAQALAEAVVERLPVLDTAAAQVTEVTTHVEGAVVAVCQTFRDIAARARETAGGGDTRHEVSEVLARTRGTLAALLTNVIESSRTFLRTVSELEQLESGMRKIERLLAQVDTVASQTRILALNASIAAARVGDRGREFAVVASEMKKLAVASHETSNGIRDIVHGVRQSTTDACSALRELAQRDLAEAEQQQLLVDDTIARLGSAHAELRAELDGASAHEAAIARDVLAAVVGLQFQDVVRQRLGRVAGALREACSALLAALPDETRVEVSPAAPALAESEVEPAPAPAPELPAADLAPGEVELF